MQCNKYFQIRKYDFQYLRTNLPSLNLTVKFKYLEGSFVDLRKSLPSANIQSTSKSRERSQCLACSCLPYVQIRK